MTQNVYKRTIESEVITTLEIQKSKFITYLSPVKSEAEAKDYIKWVKREHSKATHHCVAFVVGDIERSNDDGEPASSAGMPMLQVLRGNNLDYTIAVVVRYYGGTLLGVGGLIRAYGGSVSNALEHATLLSPQAVTTTILRFPYDAINAVETYISGFTEIIDRNYGSLVEYVVKSTQPEQLDGLIDETRGKIEIMNLETKIEYSKEN